MQLKRATKLHALYSLAHVPIRPYGRALDVMRLGAWQTQSAFSINKRIAYEYT